ncbi:kinesin-like protein [Cryptosporidium felis]|nr:kinesin-like protein [Cryptosporidium felis]
MKPGIRTLIFFYVSARDLFSANGIKSEDLRGVKAGDSNYRELMHDNHSANEKHQPLKPGMNDNVPTQVVPNTLEKKLYSYHETRDPEAINTLLLKKPLQKKFNCMNMPRLNLKINRIPIFNENNKSVKNNIQTSYDHQYFKYEGEEKGQDKQRIPKNLKLDILKFKEEEEEGRRKIRNDILFSKEKIQEKIDAEREFSFIDPSEDQMDMWDDLDLYNKYESGEEKTLKFPHEIGNPKKVSIRSHPELRNHAKEEIHSKEKMSMRIKDEQDLEFIETSSEAQDLFETAGSPFRNNKRKDRFSLQDETMVSLDMPLDHTPEGLRDILEAYFWSDSPNFDYELDKVNPEDNLMHYFDVKLNREGLINCNDLSFSTKLESGFRDLVSGFNPSSSKSIRVLISERRDLLTVKDRPFSLTRSISKGFKNVFLGRKSRKIKEKFLADLRNAITEWSDEYDYEFPMIVVYPKTKLIPTIINDFFISNEKSSDEIEFGYRNEFIEKILKKEVIPTPNDSSLFDIKLSRKLFPELKFEDIPEIKGVPINEIIIYSSTGILPNMQDFEYVVTLLKNELIEYERKMSDNEDPLDSKLLKRHILIRELPPISANEEELAQWEMEHREKQLKHEYDEFGHRKVNIKQLPLNVPVDFPKAEKALKRKSGKVVAKDEEVQKLRMYEKQMYPAFIKKTDRNIKEGEIRKISQVIEKKDKIEADLRRMPRAFVRKTSIEPSDFISENMASNEVRRSSAKELKRPHTTAMVHLDNNLRKSIIESSSFNPLMNSNFGDNSNDTIENAINKNEEN